MEKIKDYKKTIIITSIITLLPIVIGIILWNRLPNEIATHFDVNGEPNGWSSKPFTIIGLPFFIFICHIICTAATYADPKRQRIGEKIFKLILWTCPVISWFSSLSIYGYELGLHNNTSQAVMILVGIVFIVVGNYLPKCRQNYTVGIKLPWTLHDEDNWNRTHRLAGKIWIIGGVLFVVFSIIGLGNSLIVPILIGVMVLLPVLYSFVYYIKHN